MTKEKNNEPNTRGKERNGRAKEYIAPSGLSEGESAKDMEIKTIHASIANEFVRKQHYSGKIAVNKSFGASIIHARALGQTMRAHTVENPEIDFLGRAPDFRSDFTLRNLVHKRGRGGMNVFAGLKNLD